MFWKKRKLNYEPKVAQKILGIFYGNYIDDEGIFLMIFPAKIIETFIKHF
jgi:hypothetical protein